MKELYIDDAVVQMSVLDKQGFFILIQEILVSGLSLRSIKNPIKNFY